jgi:hypothetical protein
MGETRGIRVQHCGDLDVNSDILKYRYSSSPTYRFYTTHSSVDVTDRKVAIEVKATSICSFPAEFSELSKYPILDESFANPTVRNHVGVLPLRLRESE